MTEVTVEGVTYRTISDEGTYTIKRNTTYIDSDGHLVAANSNGVTVHKTDKGWLPSAIAFPLYEAIVVETQPEWGPVIVSDTSYAYDTRERCDGLQKVIAETLKAQRIRIHNVDGSVTEWVPGDVNANHNIQNTVQLAFMRGSKVEVLR